MLTAQLARRLELSTQVERRAYVQMHRKLYPDRRTCALEIGGAFASISGSHVSDEALGHRAFSRCVGLGFDEPVTERMLDELERFYDTEAVPARIDVCPFASKGLLPLLARRHYVAEAFINIWWRGPETVSFTANPIIEVSCISPVDRELWHQTMGRGFASDEAVGLDPIAHTVSHLEGKLLFLARIEGQAAGAAAAQTVDGIAMINGAATRPSYRGRGVQQALLAARIQHLAGACELMTVVTSPGSDSERNIQRFGFELAYTKLIMMRSVC